VSLKKSTQPPSEPLLATSYDGDLLTSPPIEGIAEDGAEPTSDDVPFAGRATSKAECDDDPQPEAAGELTRDHLRGLLEALVFASDRPVKVSELSRLASAPLKQVRELMTELQQTYLARGIVLVEVANGWIFRTHAQFAPFVRQITGERPVRLTRAQVESLAIVAYRQPITRPEIDDLRGVDSSATLRLLLERDLVCILGKKEEPGRPILYGTTSQFLEFFGLKSLNDLPPLREATELTEESQRIAEEELDGIAMASERATPFASEAAQARNQGRTETPPPEVTTGEIARAGDANDPEE
jgi:segregation and condensation protein B